jgi:hypothetical protein
MAPPEMLWGQYWDPNRPRVLFGCVGPECMMRVSPVPLSGALGCGGNCKCGGKCGGATHGVEITTGQKWALGAAALGLAYLVWSNR